jgi:hypothetical protein
MEYKNFESIIENLELLLSRNSSLYELGVDLTNYEEPYYKIINQLIDSIFNDKGKDWIDWYLYERPGFIGTTNKAWDENGKEICYDIPSLWDVVKDYLK